MASACLASPAGLVGAALLPGAPGAHAQAAAPAGPDALDTSPHQVRFVSVEPGVQVAVLDWGGSGTPLVFLLGGLSFNPHAFDGFVPRFTDRHRVYAITRRGHGDSSWPESGYDPGRRAEDVRAVLDTSHNIHLESPDELEASVKEWPGGLPGAWAGGR